MARIFIALWKAAAMKKSMAVEGATMIMMGVDTTLNYTHKTVITSQTLYIK